MVIGVSRDSIESHKKFKTKLDLPFLLLSDPEGKVCESYGVIEEKKPNRPGIVRSTFIIDEKGHVVNSYRGVKVKGHIEAILKALSA